MALGTAVFVVPYILLAAPAGYLADRFSKRQVIVLCKVGEVVIMALAIAGILFGKVWFMMLVLGLAGAQAALFGPAKLGSIPEMVDEPHLRGQRPDRTHDRNLDDGRNVVGSWLADVTGDKGQEHWQWSAFVLLGIAVAGWVTSLLIARLPAGRSTRRFPWDMAQQTWRDLKTLAHTASHAPRGHGHHVLLDARRAGPPQHRSIRLRRRRRKQTQVAPLLAALVIGIGVGSVLAGIWSAGRVELGILPLGAGGLVSAPTTAAAGCWRSWIPWADPLGDGFQIIQSLIAVGTGGVFGKGLMHGVQKLFYLPEPHTDFIFAVISEELGLIGATLVVLLLLRHRLARAAHRDARARQLRRVPRARHHDDDRRCRRSSTSASCSACCRPRASRCRSSATAARRC